MQPGRGTELLVHLLLLVMLLQLLQLLLLQLKLLSLLRGRLRVRGPDVRVAPRHGPVVPHVVTPLLPVEGIRVPGVVPALLLRHRRVGRYGGRVLLLPVPPLLLGRALLVVVGELDELRRGLEVVLPGGVAALQPAELLDEHESVGRGRGL